MKCRDRFSPIPETGIEFPDQGLTKQSFTEESDINNIIARHGGIPQLPTPDMGVYGDFSTVDEYQNSLNKVIEAQNAFDQLDARIKNRFSNDPAKLMDFLHDPENIQEAIKLGLAIQKNNPSLKPNTPVNTEPTVPSTN